MRVPQTAAGQPANIINHFVLVVDESYSMKHLKDTTVRVFDGFISRHAAKSKAKEQETRVTVYFFNSYGTERCVIWDMDVLRVPSLAGMYHPDGNTALLRTFLLAVRDLREIPQKYGDHSIAVFGFTDGQENDSARPRTHAAQSKVIAELHQAIVSAPDNETYGLFVPDQEGVHDAKSFGFPAGNISVWNPNSAEGIEDVGRLLDDVTEGYMEGRARGVRGYSARSAGGLFKISEVSPADVNSSLTPLTEGSYTFHDVPADQRIDEFVLLATKRPYQVGRAYYQLSKAETIQPQKQIAIETGDGVFSGPEARTLLGLPDHHIKAGFRSGDLAAGLTVFVQSTSYNRNLKAGTRLLLMR
jgi:hypothetical protein